MLSVHSGVERIGRGCAAVVIAAGRGARLGNRPKCLLKLEGEPLICRQLRILTALAFDEIVVVLGHHADVIESVLAELSLRDVPPLALVRHQTDDHTQSQSVRIGVTRLSAPKRPALICPADMPMLVAADYARVVTEFHRKSAGVVVVGPTVNGQPGNPVMLDPGAYADVLAGSSALGSGRWRATDYPGLAHFESTNPAYCVDLDTEADINAFQEQTGQLLSWPPTG